MSRLRNQEQLQAADAYFAANIAKLTDALRRRQHAGGRPRVRSGLFNKTAVAPTQRIDGREHPN